MDHRHIAPIIVGGITLVLASGMAFGADEARTSELARRGKYVFATAGGCACHTPPDAPGLNAGGFKFEGPFGVVYSRNITPDPETGIGQWTDEQIVNAIRRGERPDGSRLFPIHPYEYFANLADDDARALAAYLKTVKPVKSAVTARALKGPAPAIPVSAAPKSAPRSGMRRGEYLVKGPGHCAECHTPRRSDGSPDPAKFMAGGRGPEGSFPANITPSKDTGIGRWSEAEIARFIRTGVKPSGQRATSLMQLVIQGTSAGFKDLSEADALAIARYLKTMAPIENKVP